jgi:hypothetical protein
VTDAGPPFNVRYEIHAEDLVDYLRLAQKNLNNIGIGAGMLGVLYGSYIAWTGDAVLGAVLAAMGAFLIIVSATRHADRLRARSVGRRIIGTQATLTFDEGGIASSSAGGTGHASWASVDNVLESAETLVLRRGKLTKIWLPKRALGSPGEAAPILEFIRAHVSGITR